MAYRSTSPGQPVGKVGGRTYGDTSNILSSLYGGAQFYYLPGDHVDASFSRSSDAAFRDDGKTLVTAGSGVIRDKHYVRDENGFLVRAIKLEAARTNSLTRSEEFDHGDWANNTATITADDATAPDGTTTADKVDDTDSGSDQRSGIQSVTVPDDSLARCVSTYVKKQDSASYVMHHQFEYKGGSTQMFEGLNFNAVDGTAGGATGGVDDFGVIDYNSDWWRVWAVISNNGTGNTTFRYFFHPAQKASVGGSIDSSLTGHQHVWGAQLEGVSGGASFPSSYIATAGSSVSRAADSLSTGINFGPQEATLYGKLALNQIGALGVLAHIGDETDGWRVEVDASNNLVAKQFTGGSTASSSVALSHSFGDIVEWRAVFTSDGDVTIHASVNGGAETSGSTDTSLDLPSSFGSSNIQTGAEQDGTNTSFGDHIVALLIAPGVRTMSEMGGLV